MKRYYIPEPVAPWRDWRTYSLLVPVLSSTVGAMVFTTLAFGFTELETLPTLFLTRLVIIGVFSVGIGSTFGSAASGIEIYRKVFSKAVGAWDWIALGVSTATTVGGYALGFAALLGAVAEWSRPAQVWGPLALGLLVSLDGVCDIIELGGLFGSYGDRYETWLRDKAQWEAENGIVEPIDRSQWRAATLADFRRLAASLNGNRTALSIANLQEHLDSMRVRLDASETTVRRWLKEEL